MTDPLPQAPYEYPADPRRAGLIALIGEAPGADEVRQGRPFVGRAGQLLDRALEAAGIARAHCLVANSFRLRPPDNKIGHFFASRRRAAAEGEPLDERWGKLGAEFCRARFAAELDFLDQELRRLTPAVVVALGRVPLWALTGSNGITALRGTVLAGRMGPAPVIATFHPSYVMRQNSIGPETEASFRADLTLARRMAEAQPRAPAQDPAHPSSRPASSSSSGIGAPS